MNSVVSNDVCVSWPVVEVRKVANIKQEWMKMMKDGEGGKSSLSPALAGPRCLKHEVPVMVKHWSSGSHCSW